MHKFLDKSAIVMMLGIGLLAFGCADAWALFQVSASPRRGGQTIRFEKNEAGGLLRNEEVTIAAETDQGVQYQILQYQYEPLTSEFGHSLPAGSFIVFSPSNTIGTLRTQLETPVAMGQSAIYTSNSSGDSDEFVLVYNVRVPENQPGGIYRSRLSFTMEPVSAQAGLSPSTVHLEIRVEIIPQFRIVIQSASASPALDLGTIRDGKSSATELLRVHVDGNASGPYRLLVQLPELLTSEKGEVLDAESLLVSASGGKNGSLGLSATPSPLDSSVATFYRSSEYGGSEDIELAFTATPQAMQKSGTYTGNLVFRVDSESSAVPREIIHIPVRLKIEPIFSLETKTPGGGLNFGKFRTGFEKQQRQVELSVRSNLGEPYQVTQIVSRKMTSSEGGTLPPDQFLVKATPTKTGAVSFSSSQPVKEGEMVLFASDKNGTPEIILLDYELTVPQGSKSGAYSSEIKYSITTI